MNEKLLNILFKVGVLLISIAFLVIYYWSSQNGRFQKTENEILDTRTGTIYNNMIAGDLRLYSFNAIDGKLKLYEMKESGEWKYQGKDPIATPAPAPAAPVGKAAPGIPNKPKQ